MKLSNGLTLRSIAARTRTCRSASSTALRCVSKRGAAQVGPPSQVGYSRLAHLRCRSRVTRDRLPSRRAHESSSLSNDHGTRAPQDEGGEAADYVSVKLNSPSFSIEVTTLSPALSQTCFSLG